jgi:asparagine synthase (glutamine-hydrolysing)
VALSGLGGDEVFWGYPGFRSAPRLARVAALPGLPGLASLLAKAVRALGRPRLEKLELLSEHPLLGPYLTVRGLFPPARAARLLGAGRLPLWVAKDRDVRLDAAEYARLESATYLQNQLLRDADVFGMAHTVELRVPILDQKLVELVASLHRGHLQAGGGTKPLLAAAMSDVFGKKAATRAKKGFTFPFEVWMRQMEPEISLKTSHPGLLVADEAVKVAEAFQRGRLHWSRPWSLAALSGMARHGNLPPWPRLEGPKKVMFVLSEVFGRPGGIQRYNRAFLKAAGEEFPRAELSVVSVNDRVIPYPAEIRGRIHFAGAGPRGGILHKTRVIANILRSAWRHRPDLLVCGHINLMPIVWAVGMLSATPTALVAYGTEAWSPGRTLRWVARRADRVLSISRHTAGRMLEWGIDASRMAILSNPIDGNEFRPVRALAGQRGRNILTVTRLNASEGYKGVDRVMAALPTLRKKWPDLRYQVVGTGDDLPRLQQLAEDLGISAHVDFHGPASDEELLRIYNEADLFVMLSAGEGFGFVFLEALACGLPVIAGNKDASREPLLDGRVGRLIDLEDQSALLRSLETDFRSNRFNISPRECARDAILGSYGYSTFRHRVKEILVAEVPQR